MVALASSPPRATTRAARGSRTWTIAALAVLVLGLGLRLALGGGGVGDRSAVVMSVLLAVAGWLAAWLLVGPRAALVITLVLVALLDLAALPARNAAEYDDLEAFYRTDQMLSAQPVVPAGVDQGGVAITLLAQPYFAAAQPRFGLAGEVNGTPLQWSCAFPRGIQRIALPLPAGLASPAATGTADVRLHLTGAPDHTSEYLVVYASSRQGGFVISLEPVDALNASVTRCALA
jgi:hypothetical protein